ncbi:type II secretion system F family protein, partial [Bacillus sp. GbtcB15]|uniref:type II secretion system F family protein n=1 Tax=Bacillus sp. GbtcB15 TaxID=2824760 RepID=UPI001C2F981D
VTIVDATNILSKQTSSKALRNALEQNEEDLKSGQALSDSAAKHNRIFSSMFVNMIKAGEASGSMEETLDRLAIQYEKQHRT